MIFESRWGGVDLWEDTMFVTGVRGYYLRKASRAQYPVDRTLRYSNMENIPSIAAAHVFFK